MLGFVFGFSVGLGCVSGFAIGFFGFGLIGGFGLWLFCLDFVRILLDFVGLGYCFDSLLYLFVGFTWFGLNCLILVDWYIVLLDLLIKWFELLSLV